MDDKEYYSLMNRSSSYALLQSLKKKQKSNQKKNENKELPVKDWEIRQGQADAEMLYEKQSEDLSEE